MTNIRKLIFGTLLFSYLIFGIAFSEAQRPRLWGIAHLGGAKYKQVMVASHPKGFAAVIFTNTFGDAYSAADALLKTKKVSFIEFNLKWSDTHRFSRQDFPGIVAEARKYAVLANQYPETECAFSGATEHNLNFEDAQLLADRVLTVIPLRCVYVNNPLGKTFLHPTARIWNEVHNADAKPPSVGGKWIFSFDGSDCFDYDVDKIKDRLAGAEVFVFWTSQNNGRKNRNDTTPRPQREAYPTFDLIKAMEWIAIHRRGNVRLPSSRYTIKPKSDQHEVPPESRALKPVFIIPEKATRLDLKLDGKIIISSGAPMTFNDGRWRYYFGKYGYQIAKQVDNKKLNLWAGNKRIGTVNPAFRQ